MKPLYLHTLPHLEYSGRVKNFSFRFFLVLFEAIFLLAEYFKIVFKVIHFTAIHSLIQVFQFICTSFKFIYSSCCVSFSIKGVLSFVTAMLDCLRFRVIFDGYSWGACL